jgi:hypothetical protein
VDEAQQAWPEHLYSDYVAAAVRLTTVIQQHEQHLLFACVELYPPEIPLPPKVLPSLQKRIGKVATLVSTITVVSVLTGLGWYESALRQQLKVPGIDADVNVIVPRLAPEPALGRLVAGPSFLSPRAGIAARGFIISCQSRTHPKPSLGSRLILAWQRGRRRASG